MFYLFTYVEGRQGVHIHYACMEVRKQLLEIGFLLPLCVWVPGIKPRPSGLSAAAFTS